MLLKVLGGLKDPNKFACLLLSAMGDSLAEIWEADSAIRNRGRQNSRLTCWPNPKCMGLASMKACSLNARVLEEVATWWVQRSDKPSSIPIGPLRNEAWGFKESKTI